MARPHRFLASVIALIAAFAAGGCATEFEGEKPSSLYGQHSDAAVALYGVWDEAVTLEGRRYYIWRRSVETVDGIRFCELRLEITNRHQIARRLMQGYPEACQLFAARFVPADSN